MKRYVAELIGTLFLSLAVSLSLAGKFPVPTAVVAGLTLGITVYTLGGISGTHINPAITLGLLCIGKISIKDAAAYWVAQFLGAGGAILITNALAGGRAPVTAADSAAVFGAEALGAFLLAFGVASVVHGQAPAAAAGVTIGGSLLIGIGMASIVSNGVLNPAVAVAIGSVSVSYLVAPLIGAVASMLLYKFLATGAAS